MPLWRDTANALHHLRMALNQTGSRMSLSTVGGEALSRDGIAYIPHRHVQGATQVLPTLDRKRITPHLLRHNCAVALLQSGTVITVIRDYLGHASIATT